MIKLMGRMKTNLAETTMRRLQLAFKVRPDMVESYAMVVGNGDVELLRQAEKDAVQYGLRFEDRPSQEAKENVMNAATASLQARRDGKPGIDLSQYIYITQQLEANGNLKELAALLDFMMMKSEQAVKQKEQEAIQLQGQQNQQLAQQQSQGAMQEKAMEHKFKIEQIDREGQWDLVQAGQYPSPPSPVGEQQAQPNAPQGAPQGPSEGLSPQSGPTPPPA
jgi:hypothetical protein